MSRWESVWSLRVNAPQQHHQPRWLVGLSRLRRCAASHTQAAVEAAENIVVHATEKRK